MRRRVLIWSISVLATVLLLLVVLLLWNRLKESQQKLDEAARIIESIGNSSFIVEAEVSDTIPISTFIVIPISIPVNVSMSIVLDVPLNMSVPVKKDMMVPFSLLINQIVPVDTSFSFPDGMQPYMNDSLQLQQKLKIRFWPGFRIPFRVAGTIPVQQNLNLEMKTMRVSADIPIKMNINDSIPVKLDFVLPVSETINMPLNINSRATITFTQKIPIEADFPINIKAPVVVDFTKTPLKQKFDSLANVLRTVL